MNWKDTFGGIKNDSYQESNINRFITMSPIDLNEDQEFLLLSEVEKEMHEKLKKDFNGQ